VKKILCMLSLIYVVVLPLSAGSSVQSEGKKLSLGEWLKKGEFSIFGGLTSAEISHSYAPEIPEADPDRFMKPRTGFVGGIGYEIGSKFGLEIDLLYVQKGVMFEGSVSESTAGYNANFKATARIDELCLPILAKFRLLPNPTPYVVGGGEIAYIVSSKAIYDFNNLTEGESFSGTEDYKEGVNRIDFGLVFGGGIEFKAGPVLVLVEGRYHVGLADIAGTDPDIPEVKKDDWIKTNAIAVFLGVKL